MTDDIARVIQPVDAQTDGQYGSGIASEDEERQVKLLLEALREDTDGYDDVRHEARYPDGGGRCDLILDDNTPAEDKLLRYWRGNEDPEDYMWTRVFSPFHTNTLLTDVEKLHTADFEHSGGLLGLFYKRGDDDPVQVGGPAERFTGKHFAEKVIQDVEYWYDFSISVANVATFSNLRHSVHKQGAAIT